MGNQPLQTEHEVLMMGLFSVGKTSILEKIKTSELESTMPTVGFMVDFTFFENLKIFCWDLGGQKIYPIYRHYFQTASALIFVLDATDRDSDNLDQMREIIFKSSQDQMLKNAIVLFFVNKQDGPNPMQSGEIVQKFNLDQIHQKLFIQPCCAKDGTGLLEGFDWIKQNLK
jgi:ADP-ribosylation factor 1/2